MEPKSTDSPTSLAPGAVPSSPEVAAPPVVDIGAIRAAFNTMRSSIEVLKVMMQELIQSETAERQRLLEKQTVSSLSDMRNRTMLSEEEASEPEPRNAKKESAMTSRHSLEPEDMERNARQPLVIPTVVQVQRPTPASNGSQPDLAERSQYRLQQANHFRQSSQQEQEYWQEESMREESSPHRQDGAHQRVFPAPLESYAEDDEYDEDESSFYLNLAAFTSRRGSQNEGRTLFDSKIGAPNNPDRDCLNYFFTGNCKGKCGYSHSVDAMLTARDQLTTKPELILAEVAKVRNPQVSQDARGYQPASLSCIVEPPASTHASFGGLSPILAEGGQIWHDPAGIGTHEPTLAASSYHNPSVPPGSS